VTELIHHVRELTRLSGVRRALVPTMGALHQGHLDLVNAAREKVGPTGEVVLSIFVNPTQFGDPADLEKYPRTLETDLEKCEAQGVDVVFAPTVGEMYPEGIGSPHSISVQPGPLGSVLEGADRPGHFAGVLTVVCKFLNIAQPNCAFFGEKDYQQLTLISQMVQQLNFPVDIVGVPTRREPDGLAMSSRNAFLNSEQREQAATISRALFAAQQVQGTIREKIDTAESVLRGVGNTSYLVAMSEGLVREYDPGEVAFTGRLLYAGVLGNTRLIDNMAIGIESDT